ncbi:MAG: hypothetical protein ACFFBZ_06135 [Promethearchaeota archaeon]
MGHRAGAFALVGGIFSLFGGFIFLGIWIYMEKDTISWIKSKEKIEEESELESLYTLIEKKDVSKLVRKAISKFRKGRIKTANTYLNMALKHDPRNIAAIECKIEINRKLGKNSLVKHWENELLKAKDEHLSN